MFPNKRIQNNRHQILKTGHLNPSSVVIRYNELANRDIFKLRITPAKGYNITNKARNSLKFGVYADLDYLYNPNLIAFSLSQ